MSYTVVGTCSRCGGQVTIPDLWGSILPPTPTCQNCGAIKADHGPVIQMREHEQTNIQIGNNLQLLKTAQDAIQNRTTDVSIVGPKLREFRLSLGLTQGDMAKLFDIPVSKWSAIENGKEVPSCN